MPDREPRKGKSREVAKDITPPLVVFFEIESILSEVWHITKSGYPSKSKSSKAEDSNQNPPDVNFEKSFLSANELFTKAVS